MVWMWKKWLFPTLINFLRNNQSDSFVIAIDPRLTTHTLPPDHTETDNNTPSCSSSYFFILCPFSLYNVSDTSGTTQIHMWWLRDDSRDSTMMDRDTRRSIDTISDILVYVSVVLQNEGAMASDIERTALVINWQRPPRVSIISFPRVRVG